ncbi:MAG: hypothetical protein BWY49_00618 [Candidatus Omnitrophica bacterium ADurb.Bin314]|nr:MAG: hypothetical protein BWY49_00618 [Candidatus Omnitrophica bacterium ADurb.Bin314]
MKTAGHNGGEPGPRLGGFLNRSLDQDLVALQSGFIEALDARQIPIEYLQLGRQSVGEVVLPGERFEKIRESRRLELVLMGVIEFRVLLREREVKHLLADIVNPAEVVKPDLIVRREHPRLDRFLEAVDLVEYPHVHGIIQAHVADIGKDVRVFLFQRRAVRGIVERRLDLVLEVTVIIGPLHLVHAEVDGVCEEARQFFAGDKFFQVLDQEIDLFFGLPEIHLLFEVHEGKQRMHRGIIAERYAVLVRQFDEIAHIRDHFAAAILKSRAAAIELADLFREHKTSDTVKDLRHLREHFLVRRLEFERLHVGQAVLFVKVRVLDAVQKDRRAIDDREVLGTRETAFAEKIIGDLFAGFPVREERKEFRVEFSARAFEVHETKLVLFVEVANDVRDVPLGILIDVSVLDMDDKGVAVPLVRGFDRAVGIGKVRPVNDPGKRERRGSGSRVELRLGNGRLRLGLAEAGVKNNGGKSEDNDGKKRNGTKPGLTCRLLPSYHGRIAVLPFLSRCIAKKKQDIIKLWIKSL